MSGPEEHGPDGQGPEEHGPEEQERRLTALRRAVREPPSVPEPAAPPWVVVFGDMMALILAFFVLVLSFTRLEADRYQVFAGSILQAFGVRPEAGHALPSGDEGEGPEARGVFSPRRVRGGLAALVRRHSGQSEAGVVDLEVYEDYRGIVLTVSDHGLFESGRADVRPSAWPLLDEVLELVDAGGAELQVEAHTDDRPIRTAAFPDNDRLSAERATSIVRYLLGRAGDLPEGRLEAVARGAMRPRVANVDEASRARNRRVELVFRSPAPADRQPR